MQALFVAFLVGPFLFAAEIGWIRACMPAAIMLTSIGLRVLGVRKGWLVPMDSNPSFLKPSSQSGVTLLIVVCAVLLVVISIALVWATGQRFE